MSKPHVVAAAALLAVMTLATSGCNSGSSSPTAPQAVPLVASAVDESLFEKLNAARAANSLPRLPLDPTLSRVAEAHSAYMRTAGGLTHESPDGGNVGDRLSVSGVAFRRAAENVGVSFGHADPATFLHNEFMNSPGHRKVILDSSWTHVGIGVVGGGSETWVTQVFVAR
ncbi:MAG: CAP domain-containing protein [Thermoanaerobaculia bacterium]|nr:CAP domain-containing protein [Thermoanaerobaculia bacterium]